ncbi:MAG TPA: iron ABC transporter permease [Candidatus Binatia bacterium]
MLLNEIRFNQVHQVFGLTVVVLVYLVGLPFLFLIYGAFAESLDNPHFTLRHIVETFAGWQFPPLLGRSLVFAAGSALVAIFLGGAAAWFVERTRSGLGALVSITTLLSLTVPGLFSAIAWIVLLSPRVGLVNRWLMDVLGLTAGPFNVYSMAGMIWVEGVHGAPLAYLLVLPVLGSMDHSFIEAARVTGANTWKTLRRITLPLSFPALLSVFIFRFVRGLESFDVPAVVGIPNGITVITTEIYALVTVERNYGAANAFGLGLVLLSLVGIYLYHRVLSKSYRFVTISGKGFHAPKAELSPAWKIAAAVFLLFYVAVVALLPLAVVTWSAFTPYFMVPSPKAFSKLTLDNFRSLWENSSVFLAFENTTLVAGASALGAVTLATATSWLVVRAKIRWSWLLDLLTFVPLPIPGIMIGVALLWIYLTLPIPVYGTLLILCIGYTTTLLPLAMRFISPALAQINVELEEAAQVCGATWWRTLAHVVVPLLLPVFAGAALYVFLLIFRLVSMAIILYTPATVVVPVLIFDLWGEGTGNAVHALLLVNTVFLFPLALCYHWLLRNYRLARTA